MGAPDSLPIGDADLVRLAHDADAGAAGAGAQGEGARPGGETPGQEAAGPSTRDMLAAMLRVLLAKATKRFPSLLDVWTDGDVEMFTAAAAPLLDKYGLTPAWAAAWEVEIRAALICGPLILATMIAVRADLESERARAAKPAGSGATDSAAGAAAAADSPGVVRPKSTGE